MRRFWVKKAVIDVGSRLRWEVLSQRRERHCVDIETRIGRTRWQEVNAKRTPWAGVGPATSRSLRESIRDLGKRA